MGRILRPTEDERRETVSSEAHDLVTARRADAMAANQDAPIRIEQYRVTEKLRDAQSLHQPVKRRFFYKRKRYDTGSNPYVLREREVVVRGLRGWKMWKGH